MHVSTEPLNVASLIEGCNFLFYFILINLNLHLNSHR